MGAEKLEKVALGTVRNRKQDREEPQVINKNNLARLGTVLNAEAKKNNYKSKEKQEVKN